VDWATPERLREMESWGRWHSDGEISDPERHLVIDNTEVTAGVAAERIRDTFRL
jgi:hypothetical protein